MRVDTLPTMTDSPPWDLQCAHPVEPVQRSSARRCMTTLDRHAGLDHEYVSLMVPCLHCTAAISWRGAGWVDSAGNLTETIHLGGGSLKAGHQHEPDPRYI